MNRSMSCGLAASYAGMMCIAIAVNFLPVFLTTLSLDLGGPNGLTHEQLGRLAGATFVGLVGGILLGGPLADRMGPKPFTVCGHVLIAAGLTLLGLAPGYGTACLAAFVMGAGAGVLDMVLSPIVCALQPHRRTAAMNWLHSFYCTGSAATVLACALALRTELGWRALSLWLALAPLVVAAAFACMRVPALVAEGGVRTPLRELAREPYFLVGLAAILLVGSMEAGLAQWIPAYAETCLGYSRWISGMALLFFSLAMAAGRITVGMLGERVSPYSVLLACCLGSAVLIVVASCAPQPAVALTACMVVGVAASCQWPSTLGVVADRFPRGGASMFGLLAASGNVGGMIMPWLVGVVADTAGMRWGISTATVCPLAVALLLPWMRKRGVTRPVAVQAGGQRAPGSNA